MALLSAVDTWSTAVIDTAGMNNWRSTVLTWSTMAIADVTYQDKYFYFTDYMTMYTAGDPASTSGIAVVSMRSTPYPQFVYGILEATAYSSRLVSLQSATSTLATTSQTSSRSQSSSMESAPAQATTAPAANASDSSLGGGAIAGIVIGGVLAFALIIGGWFFWRRRKRAKTATSSSGDDVLARRDGDIPEMDTKYAPQEMPGRDQAEARELDPTQYSNYTAYGSHELMGDQGEYHFKPTHEFNPDSQPRELTNGATERTSPVHHQDLEPAAAMPEATVNATSSNVEAQRRREMEWLEMEEERIRKRREMLAMQGSPKT